MRRSQHQPFGSASALQRSWQRAPGLWGLWGLQGLAKRLRARPQLALKLALALPLASSIACQERCDETTSVAESEGDDHFETPPGERLNVVVVVFESLRSRSATPYAPDLETTPFLDSLAKGGVLVNTAYTVIPHTSKALVSIFCGLYPEIVKAVNEAEPGALPRRCLAQSLSEGGYGTLFIQPARPSFENRASMVERLGFEEFLGPDDLPRAGFDESSYFGYEDDIMLAPALEWVDRQGESPFFLAVLTLTPHHDYGVPVGFPSKPYVDDPTLNNYLNTVAYTDRFIGKLHAGLEDRGLLENTIFVVSGDHGEGFGEHGRTQHDNVLWEEGLRVPLLLSGPGVGSPGMVIDGLRQTIDIVPTIASLLGLQLNGHMPGLDLFETAGHERLFASCWANDLCMAMLEGDRKAIYHYEERSPEVFDLTVDPLEQTNILDEGDNRDFADDAIAAMLDWKTTTNTEYACAADER